MQAGTELYVAAVVAAVTSAITIVAFVVMIVNDIRYHRQDVYRFDSLDKEAGGLNARHDRATEEHDGLTREHDRLTREHDRLSTEHNDLRERLEKIYLNQEKDKSAREAASKIMPKESKLVDLISEIYENHKQLIARNAELEQEVKQLRRQLLNYMQEQPGKEGDWKLDDILGYEPEGDEDEREM